MSRAWDSPSERGPSSVGATVMKGEAPAKLDPHGLASEMDGASRLEMAVSLDLAADQPAMCSMALLARARNRIRTLIVEKGDGDERP